MQTGGRESVYRALNKVTKLLVVLDDVLSGDRGRRLGVDLRGEPKGGGGREGRGGRREGGGGVYGPLKVTKLVTVLGENWGEGMSGDRRV